MYRKIKRDNPPSLCESFRFRIGPADLSTGASGYMKVKKKIKVKASKMIGTKSSSLMVDPPRYAEINFGYALTVNLNSAVRKSSGSKTMHLLAEAIQPLRLGVGAVTQRGVELRDQPDLGRKLRAQRRGAGGEP